MKTATKPYLEQPFYHNNWFTKIDETTGEPEISNKLAIMYFASTGDFILNSNETAIQYTGREGGQCRGKQKIEYFKTLINRVKKAKKKGLQQAEKLKNKLSFENDKFYFLHDGIFICVSYWNEKHTHIITYFKEYLDFSNPNYFDDIKLKNLK